MKKIMKTKKNVMLIVPSLVSGGQERVAVNTATILAERYNITLAVFTMDNAVYNLDCRVVDLNVPSREGYRQKTINALKRITALKRLKQRLKIDVSISFGTSANLANVFSKVNDKIVISIHGYRSLMRSLKTKTIDRTVYFKSDAIICVSEKMARDLASLFHIPHDKVFTVHNPYDSESLSNHAGQPIPLRFRHPTVITMGRLEKVKGYRHLLHAFAHVHREIPEANLVFLGNGSQRDELEGLAMDLGLSDSIIFLGFQSNPFSYLAKCDLYALSSINEGFPNALVEAMACGLPVIATDCKSGPREILTRIFDDKVADGVEEAEYGILVTPFIDDESDEPALEQNLAEAIRRLLQDEHLSKHYKERSLQRARLFSFEAYRTKMITIIEG